MRYDSIKNAVFNKYGMDEEILEWWFSKFARARRFRLKKLYHKVNGLCCFCERKTSIVTDDEYRYATYEHIIPSSQGGSEHPLNMELSCNSCNTLRGTIPFAEFDRISHNQEEFQKFKERRLRKGYEKRLKTLRKLNEDEEDENKKDRKTILSLMIAILMFDSGTKKFVMEYLDSLETRIVDLNVKVERNIKRYESVLGIQK